VSNWWQYLPLPDVACYFNAQKADRQGNIWIDGIVGVQKEVFAWQFKNAVLSQLEE